MCVVAKRGRGVTAGSEGVGKNIKRDHYYESTGNLQLFVFSIGISRFRNRMMGAVGSSFAHASLNRVPGLS